MAKLFWKTTRIAICMTVCCFLSLAHKIFSNTQYEDVQLSKKTINYRVAYRNRNIASVYDDVPVASNGSRQAKNASSNFERFNSSNDLKPLSKTYNNNIESSSLQNKISLEDLFISVKTSHKFHSSRLQLIIDTWFQFAANQTYFFTDAYDARLDKLTGYHMINTYCKDSHTRHDLSCKMSAEYDGFMDSDKKWWCHFDDDNYVNIDQLVVLLGQYKWTEDVYLGKASLGHPFHVTFEKKKEEFWFATGGAGVCITRALGYKMAPWCRHGELAVTSDRLRVPDDCTVGFVVTNRLGVNLTKSDLLHSHLEGLKGVDLSTINDQVTLSYHLSEDSLKNNVVHIPDSVVDSTADPTHLRYIHCLIYPQANVCK